MVVVDKTFLDMLVEIEFEKVQARFVIIPSKVQESKKPKAWNGIYHFGYSKPDYLRKEVRRYDHKEVLYKVCSEALANAFDRGNNKNKNLPIELMHFSGKRGGVFRIRDSGDGFDFERTQKKFEEGIVYFRLYGVGFEYYNLPDIYVAFEEPGNVINIMDTKVERRSLF